MRSPSGVNLAPRLNSSYSQGSRTSIKMNFSPASSFCLSSSTVLAQAIVKEGMKYVAAGMNPMDLKRGIDKAVSAAIGELKKLSKPCATAKEIAQVGSISANSDTEIGKIIADAMEKVGKEGVITVEDGSGLQNELEVVEEAKMKEVDHDQNIINTLKSLIRTNQKISSNIVCLEPNQLPKYVSTQIIHHNNLFKKSDPLTLITLIKDKVLIQTNVLVAPVIKDAIKDVELKRYYKEYMDYLETSKKPLTSIIGRKN